MAAQVASDLSSVVAIGLMSGTPQDGVDVALIDTDGEIIAQLGPTAYRPYARAERTLLRRAAAPPRRRGSREPERAQRLAPARVETADEAGWSIVQAFAYLAVRSLRGLPITLPTTTGAPRPLVGGVLAEP
jgi:1,6-anhydro-N-acetylmuramate kinase